MYVILRSRFNYSNIIFLLQASLSQLRSWYLQLQLQRHWQTASYWKCTHGIDLCRFALLKSLTLPLPNSHLCENYLPLPNLHLCEIHMWTCVNSNRDISLHAWLKIANQNSQWHRRNVLLHFKSVWCAHTHSFNLYCAHGLPRGFPLKNKSIFRRSFRGKSVEDELITSWITTSLPSLTYMCAKVD